MKYTTNKKQVREVLTAIEKIFLNPSPVRAFHKITKRRVLKQTPVSSWPKEWFNINYKAYPRFSQILLDNPKKINKKLTTVLHQRCSFKNYSNKPISNLELSTLLYYSAGVRDYSLTDGKKRRFYPSAGARYPLELYPVIFNVSGIKKGIYHYNVKCHSLEVLFYGNFLRQTFATLKQQMVKKASIAVLISVVFGRTEKKYQSRGYRYIFLEAGHLAQNMLLTAEALDISSCAVGGFIDDKADNLLELDGDNESVIYILVFGEK